MIFLAGNRLHVNTYVAMIFIEYNHFFPKCLVRPLDPHLFSFSFVPYFSAWDS